MWRGCVSRKMSDEAAKKSYERACRLEAEFTEYFTAIVEADTIDAIYEKVHHRGPGIFVFIAPKSRVMTAWGSKMKIASCRNIGEALYIKDSYYGELSLSLYKKYTDSYRKNNCSA